MRTRSTLILAVVVAALGTWIYLVESEGPTTSQLEERKDNVFAAFDREKVDSIELSRGGKTVRLAKKDGKWRIRRPVETGADSGAVDSLLSAIEFLTKTRTIDAADAKKKRAELGLAHPRVRGKFRIGGRDRSFAVGGEDATGQGIYLSVGGDDHVYVVPKDFHDSVDKGLADLRDKRIVEVRVSKAKAITIRGGPAEVRLVRAEGAWSLRAPAQGRASKARVEDLLRQMDGMRADRFVADDAEDLSRYGLEPAWRSVKVELEGGSAAVLLIGSACAAAQPEGESEDTGLRHVARQGSRSVACAQSDLFATLDKDPTDLRERRLVMVRDEDAAHIELATKSRKVRLEREGDDWRLTKPSKSAADRDAVVRLLSELRSLQATEFTAAEDLAARGLDPPAATLTIDPEGDAPAEVLHVGTVEGDSVWVRRGEEEQVLRAPARLVELVAADALRFRPRRVVQDDPIDAVSMKIQSGGTTEQLKKTEGVWRLERPVAFRADSLSTRDVVRRIAELTAERWVAERAEPAHGLSSPRLRVTVRFEGHAGGDDEDADGGAARRENVREVTLVVGAQTDGGYFARLEGTGGSDAVFVVAAGLVDDASVPLLDRNLFQIDEASLASLTIAHGGTSVELVHDGEGWKRGDAEVERDHITPLLDKLASVRALRAVGFGPAPALAGMSSPSLTVTAVRRQHEDGEPDRLEMRFGSATGQGAAADAGFHARRADVDATFVVPKDVVDAFTEAGF